MTRGEARSLRNFWSCDFWCRWRECWERREWLCYDWGAARELGAYIVGAERAGFCEFDFVLIA